MRKLFFDDENGVTFTRINKTTARKLYNAGLDVVFCPCNLRPFNRYGFGLDMRINKDDISNDGRTFDTVVNYFEYYNCRDTETGKYTAFYMPCVWVDRSTGEIDKNGFMYCHNNYKNKLVYNPEYMNK